MSAVADWRSASIEVGPQGVTGGVLAGWWSPVVRRLEEARCSDSGSHTSLSERLSELNDEKKMDRALVLRKLRMR